MRLSVLSLIPCCLSLFDCERSFSNTFELSKVVKKHEGLLERLTRITRHRLKGIAGGDFVEPFLSASVSERELVNRRERELRFPGGNNFEGVTGSRSPTVWRPQARAIPAKTCVHDASVCLDPRQSILGDRPKNASRPFDRITAAQPLSKTRS